MPFKSISLKSIVMKVETANPRWKSFQKLAIALSVSADVLIFDEGEREPDDSLKFQFETIGRFDDEDKRVAQAVLEGLILKIPSQTILTAPKLKVSKIGL